GYGDNTYRPENNITRAEVCKMICVALNGGKEPTLSVPATPTFKDVRNDANSSWAEKYIESCVAQGIVGGVGNGMFQPSQNVTGSQLAKMLLVALGYKSENEGFGGNAWDTKVNVIASAKGLYEGLEKLDTSAALTRDSAAQMIWNALNAYEVEYKNQLTTVNGQLVGTEVVQDRIDGQFGRITLLEDKYEAKTFIGTFTGNYDTGAASKEGYIDVGGKDIPFALDLKYIGEEVKVLFKESKDGVAGLDSKDTIYGVYVTGETTVYNIIKDDIQKVTADKIKFNDKEHDYVTGTINYNYGLSTGTMNQATLKSLAVASGDTVKFVENSNGKIVAAYVIESNMAKVTAVNSTKISLEGVGSIDIEGNDVYSGVTKDDVVVYTKLYNTNKDDATFVIAKAETVSGTVKSFYGVEKVNVDGTTYFIDATELDANNKMANLTDDTIAKFENANLEEAATLYLINGFVGAADSQATETKYALVTAVDNMGAIGNAINGAKVQLLTLDGKTIYNVDEDSQDNFKYDNDKDGTPDYDLTSLAEGTLVEFALTSDDTVEIKAVFTNPVKLAANDAVYDKDTKSLTTAKTNNILTTTISDTDAVFFTSTDGKGSDYKAYTLRSLGDITASSATDVYFVLNDDGTKVVAAFADLGNKPSGASSNTLYGMITKVEQNVKVDGVNYNKYTVWTGEDTTVYTKDTFEKGDFVYFDKTSDDLYAANEIKALGGQEIWVVEYEENDKVLTYKTSLPGTDAAKAVDDDVQIVYVDKDGNKAGDTIGVNKYDTITGYANAIIVDTDNDGKIDAIMVETSNECNIRTTESVTNYEFGYTGISNGSQNINLVFVTNPDTADVNWLNATEINALGITADQIVVTVTHKDGTQATAKVVAPANTEEAGSYSWVGPFCIVSDSSDATITAIRPKLDSDAAFLKVHTDTKFQTGDKVSVLINAGNGASFTEREVATVG
ncbi:MAG: S-layer homology domain-containing protein, partial [Clostridiales bacterium]|nr:S-layer homology domain-containing protein [Clostridiales bacterium]